MKKELVMDFSPGEKLSTEELYKRLGISKDTWKRNRKDILVELANVYAYEVAYQGRSIIYTFLKQVGEYKSDAAARDEAFESAIVETISEQPLNTAANVARVINEEWHEVTSLRLYRENSL